MAFDSMVFMVLGIFHYGLLISCCAILLSVAHMDSHGMEYFCIDSHGLLWYGNIFV
jgi:hypothetical protein